MSTTNQALLSHEQKMKCGIFDEMKITILKKLQKKISENTGCLVLDGCHEDEEGKLHINEKTFIVPNAEHLASFISCQL